MRRLYDWVLSWADSRYGLPALFVLAFLESSVFPVPPDILLIALALGSTKKAFRFAAVCTVGSVLGGVAGYGIGWFAAPLARDIIEALGGARFYYSVAKAYGDNAFVAIALAGFTPIPYKVFTLAAGIFHESVPLHVLIVASALSRAARFFLVSALIYVLGPTVKRFIDRWFNILALLFGVLLVGSFFLIGFVTGKEPGPEEKARVLLQEMRHPDAGLRKIAFEDMKKLASGHAATPPDFGYDPAADPGSNEEALRRWEKWWER